MRTFDMKFYVQSMQYMIGMTNDDHAAPVLMQISPDLHINS